LFVFHQLADWLYLLPVLSLPATVRNPFVALRSIYATHDESKDKDFELELAWVCADSNGQFEHVPENLHKEAEAHAQATMEEDSDSDEEEEGDSD